MSIIKFSDLPKIRKKHKNEKIVVCSGCFDLTHAGHVLFLEDCKKQGDILVVVLGPDSNIRGYKPGRPILNEHLRLKMVDSLKPVDYALLDIESDDLIANLVPLFEKLQPDVYVINSDAHNQERRHKLLNGFKTKFVTLERTAPKEFEKISTSKIIEKIKNLKN